MKKLMIFPYHPDVECMAAHKDTIQGYTISGVYSYKEDMGMLRELNHKIGWNSDGEALMDECDTVLLLDNYRQCREEKYFEIIREAEQKGKELLLVPQLVSILSKNFQMDKCRLVNNPDFTAPEFERLDYLGEKKFVIEVPVIAVLGMGKNCNKFENQINLYRILREKGYRVAWLSSNSLGALWGGYTLPEFLFDEKLSFKEKVLRFNRFVYKLSLLEQPDVLLIGIPEGISEFQFGEFHHFAEYPLIVGSAVPVDSAVFCTFFIEKPKPDSLCELMEKVKIRFGCPVDAVSIGKTMFETEQGSGRIHYSFLEDSYLKKYYRPGAEKEVSLLKLWEKEEYRRGLQDLLERLEDNADAI